jgi:hypothetical protein
MLIDVRGDGETYCSEPLLLLLSFRAIGFDVRNAELKHICQVEVRTIS